MGSKRSLRNGVVVTLQREIGGLLRWTAYCAHICANGPLENQVLIFLELQDAFLDGAGNNEAKGLNRLKLTQPVGMVNSLTLGSRIPPRIHQENAVATTQKVGTQRIKDIVQSHEL